MSLLNRIRDNEYPYNFAYEIIFPNKIDKLPKDIEGTIEYILYTVLTERERKIIVMHWRDKYSLREISQTIGNITQEAIRNTEKRAIEKIKILYSEYVKYGIKGLINQDDIIDKKDMDPNNIFIWDANLPARLYNSLYNNGLITLGMVKKEIEDNCCRKLPNFGRVSMVTILKIFSKYRIDINNIQEVLERWNIKPKDLLG